LFGVYAFLFTTLLGVRIGGEGVPPGAMGVYMFTGTLVWASFSEALTRSSTCVVEQGHLVRSVRFPAELLPLQVTLSALVTFVMGALAFVAFTLVTGVWPVPTFQQLAWAPLLLVLQLLLATGFGLGLASVNVLWRDAAPLLTVALTVWMFATPVFWVASPELLPGVAPYLGWIEANPLYHLVQTWRAVLMGSEPAGAFAVDFGDSAAQLAAWSIGVFSLGSLTFFRLQRHLADEV
jgi:lipopolysaccharide transport system permease protein